MQLHSLTEQLFFCTVRVFARWRDEEGHGTAFFLGAKRNDDAEPETFIVTNRHLVQGALSGEFYFLPRDENGPTLAAPLTYCWSTFDWSFHPDPDIDVAVMPLSSVDFEALDDEVLMFVVPPESVFPRWYRSEHPFLDIIRRPQPVTEVLLVGYPSNYFDRTNGLPLLRRGLTATPLSVDFEGRPVFLLDSAVVKGSSGSPVFYLEGNSQPSSVKLLGIVSDVLPWKPRDWFPEPEVARPLINLGAAFKAHTILETIEAFWES